MARSAAAPGTAQGGRWRLLAVRAGSWHSPAVRGGRGAGCLLRLFLLGRCLRGARGGAGWSGRGGGPCCAFGICGKKGKKAQPGSLPLQGKRCGRCSGSERTSPSCRGTLRPLCCVQSTQPEVGSNPSPGGIAVGSQQSQSPQHAHTPQAEFRLQEGAPGTLCATGTDTARKWGGSWGSTEPAVRAGGRRQGEGRGGGKGPPGMGRRAMHHSHGAAAPAAPRRGHGDTWKAPRCPGDLSWRSPVVHGRPPPPGCPFPQPPLLALLLGRGGTDVGPRGLASTDLWSRSPSPCRCHQCEIRAVAPRSGRCPRPLPPGSVRSR